MLSSNICSAYMLNGAIALLIKTTAAQNEDALSYYSVRGLYFLAVISVRSIWYMQDIMLSMEDEILLNESLYTLHYVTIIVAVTLYVDVEIA